ncbi:hypothetical protein NKR19_g4839 [Coniochaeta hoffmannii]|uniref:Uncharacterized protein n=1 Tax=Coniochaeta hoffmannii TaxID=91930 RepID=A0AA38VXG9_9PEZI|nr:hypothetical protein NKR19_g4839 [Coniochaeta hoffmannii]
MSSSPRNNYSSFSMSPSPPTDIGSYSRFMHQHTKRQMDAANRSSQRRSNHHTSNRSVNGATPSMPNGVSSRSSRSPDDHGYQS